MQRRSNLTKPPATIDVRGVLGHFKVPNANLTVEYILTYASLDEGNTPNGQLLDLLVPVREVFSLNDLSFDHLLQRDLDDYRVSEEMVPYLLGNKYPGEVFSEPRFFPPILAIIVPMKGENMNELYPKCIEIPDEEDEVPLQVFKYGNVFSVKREKGLDGQLAQSSVDLCIHPTQAKLVIVDGQHRAMAMLAAYRGISNKWDGNGFQYFYKEINLDDISDKSILHQIHLPVCIAYFPELTLGNQADQGQIDEERNLTTACRRLFLDVNRNARQPSKAREILLDDTDLVACFTRQLFNMVKQNTETNMLQLHHTEYDNPHDKIPTTRPLALTNVYSIYSTLRSILLTRDETIWNPLAQYGSGRPAENNERLRRELNLEAKLTEKEKEQYGIEISNITYNNYPRQGEVKFRQCFEEGWGRVMVNSLSNFYPFSKHIEAVDTTLETCERHIRENKIAYIALVEGQGLRHTLDQKQKRKTKQDNEKKDGVKSDIQKAWEVLKAIEEEFKICRTRLYLQLNTKPDKNQIRKVNSLFDCFGSNAFQSGMFMAFAYLKARLGITENQDFISYVDKWIDRLNEKFKNNIGAKEILFDNNPESESLRYIYAPGGGINPSDGYFFRYLILELLSGQKDVETESIEVVQKKWRPKMYEMLYKRWEKEFPPADRKKVEIQKTLDDRAFQAVKNAFKKSFLINEVQIDRDLEDIRGKVAQSILETKDDEVDEMDDFPEHDVEY